MFGGIFKFVEDLIGNAIGQILKQVNVIQDAVTSTQNLSRSRERRWR